MTDDSSPHVIVTDEQDEHTQVTNAQTGLQCPDTVSSATVTDDQTTCKTSVSGLIRNVIGNLNNMSLPATPPARGRSCFKTVKIAKKENVFQSRKRSLKRVCGAKNQPPTKNTCTFAPLQVDLVRSGGMLDDSVIYAASQLLKSIHSDMGGFYDPVLGSKLQFPVCKSGIFCQILHDGGAHWVAVSNLYTNGTVGEVDVYDSLCSVPSLSLQMQVASIVMSTSSELHLNMRKFQRQRRSVDCGLFAITSLCYGIDPSSRHYRQHEMREHLLSCIAVWRVGCYCCTCV